MDEQATQSFSNNDFNPPQNKNSTENGINPNPVLSLVKAKDKN